MKSLRVAWYKRPLVQDAFFTDIQTGAVLAGVFSIVSTFVKSQTMLPVN